MASFYELKDKEVEIILESLKFHANKTWGEFLNCSRDELDELMHYLEERERV